MSLTFLPRSSGRRLAGLIAIVGIGAAVLAPGTAFATPMVADDSYTLGAASPFTPAVGAGLFANDTEVNVPGAIVKIQAGPTHGGLSNVESNGGFTYTPSSGFIGTDTFTYCVSLGAGCVTGSATVSLTVVTHVERIGAADRFAESAAISRSRFTVGLDVVYVASGAVFADALSAGAAAGTLSAPILLVTRDSIPGAVKDELARLIPKKIVVLGGVNTVSAAVEAELVDYAPVERVGGADRYEVSAAVSQGVFAPGRRVAYVASGEVFPDALSASAAAGVNGGPVLLAQKEGLPPAVAAELGRLKPAKIVVLGGVNTISDAVVARLQMISPTTRVAGADRYAVSAAASAGAFDPKETRVVYIASGENFPDALAGSPVAVVRPAPVLLVSKNSIPADVAAELRRINPVRIVVLGGPNSISPQVETDLAGYLAK